MWYKNINLVFIILIFWLATVKGSCLEYGHSCWGAHGKRSGGKVFRTGADITNAELALLPDGSNENHVAGAGADATVNRKSYFETLQDAEENNALPLNANNNEDEIITPSKKQIQATKLRNLLRKRHSELLARKSLLDVESAELPELRVNNQPAATAEERWHRIPTILKLKNFNNPVDGNERRRGQQEAKKKFLSKTTDDGSSYFDY